MIKAEQNQLWQELRWIPYAALAAVLLLQHAELTLFSDDGIYQTVVGGGHLVDWLQNRYRTWSSRLLIELVLVGILHLGFWVWKVLNTAVMVALAALIRRLFLPGDSIRDRWLAVCALLLYPLYHLNSAGWATTTINYLWPLAAGLVAMLPIKKLWDGLKPRWYEYLYGTAALLFAVNQEQMAAILLLVYAALAVVLWRRGQPHPFVFVQLGICAVGIAFILSCPGNYLRRMEEIGRHFPDMDMLTLPQKLELGLTSTLSKLLFEPNAIFFLFALLLLISVFARYRDPLCRAISAVPLIVHLAFGVMREWFVKMMPGLNAIRYTEAPYGSITLQNCDKLASYLPAIVLAMTFLCALAAVCLAFREQHTGWFGALLLLGGLGSRVMMGLSPSIWFSSDRTFFFLYLSILLVIVLLLRDFHVEKRPQAPYLMAGLAGLCALQVLSFLGQSVK